MNVLTSSDYLGEAVARAQGHWQARLKAATLERHTGEHGVPAAPTIALARQEGANGTALAHEIGVRLGWPVYDHELLQRIADEMGLKRNLLESIDERGRNWLVACLEAFASDHAVSQEAYLYQLAKVVLSLATHGQCVIVGRGTALYLPPETTLRVRAVAPLDSRIMLVQQRFNLTRQQAERRVEETDSARLHFERDHFHKDPTDPSNYDLTLNTTRFSLEKCAELVVEALHRLPVHSTPNMARA